MQLIANLMISNLLCMWPNVGGRGSTCFIKGMQFQLVLFKTAVGLQVTCNLLIVLEQF